MSQNRPRIGTNRVAAAARNVSEQDRVLDAQDREVLPQTVAIVPLATITMRQENTRAINAEHAVHLMISVLAVGLIEPIAVDKHNRLLAGLHRYSACAVLAESDADLRRARAAELLGLDVAHSADRELLDFIGEIDAAACQRALPKASVPVRRYEFDAETEPEKALAVEIAENEIRRDYTAKEVRDWHRRLVEGGYISRVGRPRRWQQSATQALADIVGKSDRTIRRMLGQQTDGVPDNREEIRTRDLISSQMSKVSRAADAWMKALATAVIAGQITSADRDALLRQLAHHLCAAADNYGHLDAWLQASDPDAIEIEP